MSDWIKCSERLPERTRRLLNGDRKGSDKVLVLRWSPMEGIHFISIGTLVECPNGDLKWYDEMRNGWADSEYIKRWMPLPEVPEGE